MELRVPSSIRFNGFPRLFLLTIMLGSISTLAQTFTFGTVLGSGSPSASSNLRASQHSFPSERFAEIFSKAAIPVAKKSTSRSSSNTGSARIRSDLSQRRSFDVNPAVINQPVAPPSDVIIIFVVFQLNGRNISNMNNCIKFN